MSTKLTNENPQPPLADATGSEILTTEEKLTEDRKRLAFLRSKAKYAPPVKGMFGGAWQITLTVGPGETVAPDFFDALDRARQIPNDRGQARREQPKT